jgi:hypothetical protein
MMDKQTAVEWLVEEIMANPFRIENDRLWDKAKEMEKQQSIGLIKQTVMFMAASHLDEDIANMSYEDVYKTYYNETFKNTKE